MGHLVPPSPRRRPVVLTPLQHRVAAILIQLPEARDFVLAGGGAPVARGEVDRTTRDLDYFARTAEEVPLLLAALEHALRTDGLEVTTTRASGGFARLVISDGPASTEVDLAHDFRLLPPEQTPVGLTLAGEELAIDKVLALFDRAEAGTSSTSRPWSTVGGSTTSASAPRRRTAASISGYSRSSSIDLVDCQGKTSRSQRLNISGCTRSCASGSSSSANRPGMANQAEVAGGSLSSASSARSCRPPNLHLVGLMSRLRGRIR